MLIIKNVIENNNYKKMIESQVFDICNYLINSNNEFSITANIEAMESEPEIPDAIFESFAHFTMFSLVNYTFQSIELTSTHISFEAGFGSENFGSVVKLPLFTIFQIVIEESILYLNPIATIDKFVDELDDKIEEVQHQRSLNAFTMNSKNKDLI